MRRLLQGMVPKAELEKYKVELEKLSSEHSALKEQLNGMVPREQVDATNFSIGGLMVDVERMSLRLMQETNVSAIQSLESLRGHNQDTQQQKMVLHQRSASPNFPDYNRSISGLQTAQRELEHLRWKLAEKEAESSVVTNQVIDERKKASELHDMLSKVFTL